MIISSTCTKTPKDTSNTIAPITYVTNNKKNKGKFPNVQKHLQKDCVAVAGSDRTKKEKQLALGVGKESTNLIERNIGRSSRKAFSIMGDAVRAVGKLELSFSQLTTRTATVQNTGLGARGNVKECRNFMGQAFTSIVILGGIIIQKVFAFFALIAIVRVDSLVTAPTNGRVNA